MGENPLALKRKVVEAGLAASELERGQAADAPLRALRAMGDPVMVAITGLVLGAIDRGAPVTLAGGTQMLTVGALVRHAGIADPLEVATTTFVAEGETADATRMAEDFDLTLRVIDPGFAASTHDALAPYTGGEGKEGVGMGGALLLAEREGRGMRAVRERIMACCRRVNDPRA